MAHKDRLKTFQQKARERLGKILEKNSRAFLADEAGLGKTFVSTAVMVDLAKKQWKQQQKGKETPFFALYVGPNTALLEKCFKDIQNKFKAMGESFELVDPTDPLPRLEEELRKIIREKMPNQLKDVPEAENKFIGRFCEEYKKTGNNSELAKNVNCAFWNVVPEKAREKCKDRTRNPIWNSNKDYLRKYSESKGIDRLALFEPGLYSGKKIVLLPTSINLMGNCGKGSKEERAALDGKGNASVKSINDARRRKEAEMLKSFGLVILDEYHRYTGNYDGDTIATLDDHAASIFEAEKASVLKVLFVSATPYRANCADQEDYPANEKDYMDAEQKDGIDLKALPGFETFARLFCGGAPECTERECTELVALNKTFTQDPGNEKAKNALEEKLKVRMIRNTRTQLSASERPEIHEPLYETKLCEAGRICCEEQLENMRQQCLKINGAGDWPEKMPWLMTFSAKYGSACKMIENSSKKNVSKYQIESNQFANLKEVKPDETMLLYDGSVKDGCREKILTLPKQNIAFKQLCDNQLTEQMAQLIWLPPTVPVYPVGEGSIFAKLKDHSKLLVFGEYLYLQRGGSLLLSEYARALNSTYRDDTNKEKPVPKGPEFKLCYAQQKELLKYPMPDGTTPLEEPPSSEEDRKRFYAALAAPGICAMRLLGAEMTESVKFVEDCFNAYFNRDGVRQALCKWIVTHAEDPQEPDWELGLLQYCAEGNLCAVLSEWFYTQRITKPDIAGADVEEIKKQDVQLKQRLEPLLSCLTREPSAVYPQTLKTLENAAKLAQQGCQDKETAEKIVADCRDDAVDCPFAERLTYDKKDNGASSSGGEQEYAKTIDAFNSPFYPMVLFVGRGAQEGLDFHLYCNRIMHLTLPRGPVSFDQRQGRIDRFGSLLVRRRAWELRRHLGGSLPKPANPQFFDQLFYELNQLKTNLCPVHADDALFPEWQIKEDENYQSNYHFQRLVPIVEYTKDARAYAQMENSLKAYRMSYGSSTEYQEDIQVVDLTTK